MKQKKKTRENANKKKGGAVWLDILHGYAIVSLFLSGPIVAKRSSSISEQVRQPIGKFDI